MKTLSFSSQAFLGFDSTSEKAVVTTSSNGSSTIINFGELKPAVLTPAKFISFSVPRQFNFNKLVAPFKLTPGCREVVHSLNYKEQQGDMFGGFCRIDVKTFTYQNALRSIRLLSTESGRNIRPGTFVEFLCFLKEQKPRRDLPDLVLVLGNLLFGALFTKLASEFDILTDREELDRGLLIFCVEIP